jgi:F-type H+-transporting ATPase subunit gamma
MSKRRELKERLVTLDEIEGIMSAMKNLALLEIRKLEVFLGTQRRAVASIEMAAQDFLSFYPHLQPHPDDLQQLWIVIGSERGFCGDFNEMLLQFLNANAQQTDTLLIAIGRRLEAKLYDDKRVAAFIEGHSVAEEIQGTLLRLIEMLNQLQQQPELAKIGRISAVYYDDETGSVQLRQLLPLAAPKAESTSSTFSHPPILNLEPTQFLSQLTDQYLYAALHEVFYASLMVENHKRLEHMNSAINRLEKDEAQLRLSYNKLRQEEIIEEIEIILLSAEALTETDKTKESALS